MKKMATAVIAATVLTGALAVPAVCGARARDRVPMRTEAESGEKAEKRKIFEKKLAEKEEEFRRFSSKVRREQERIRREYGLH